MRQNKILGFALVTALWVLLSFLCYHRVVVFENATLSGAMLSGFILLTSILSIIRLLKIVYDGTYSALIEEKENN